MPDFGHILNVKTRAIPPEYNAQWYDRIWSYSGYTGDDDFIVDGYPYSTANQQIVDSPYTLTGEKNEGALVTMNGGDVINTIGGGQMRRIYP